jgi:hypothetical protein
MSHIIDLSTSNVKLLKIIVNLIASIATDKKAELEFFKIDGKKELRIYTVDSTQTTIISLKLDKKFFTRFKLIKEIIDNGFKFGINFGDLTTFMKTISNNSLLSIYIEEETYQYIIFESTNGNYTSRCKLRAVNGIIDLNKSLNPNIMIGFKMKSDLFQSICASYNDISSTINISLNGRVFKMSCNGSMNSMYLENIFKEDDNFKIIDIKTDGKIEFNQTYSLEQIIKLNKCSKLCDSVNILICSQNLIYLRYPINTNTIIGELIIGLCPKVNDDIDGMYHDQEIDMI